MNQIGSNSYEIIPAVDAVREFLEIAGDFTNPLEIVREAISNSIDAGAKSIKIGFDAEKQYGNYVLQVIIRDDGNGMDLDELQSFFDLGNSKKRNQSNLIGEKGHGTKVFFNCSLITVATAKNGKTLIAEMERPFASLHDGNLPKANVREQSDNSKNGTEILIKGFNNNQGELFTHERLKDYIKWFTKFASFQNEFGSVDLNDLKIELKGLDQQEYELVTFGHEFPQPSDSMQKLFDEYLVRAPDYYCRRITRKGKLRRHPYISFEAIFSIEGNRIKHNYNKMVRRPGYSAPDGAYTVQERYGLWLCKDFIPIERKNDWISLKGYEYTKFHAFFNCQHLSLTANRGSIANTPPAILEDIQEAVHDLYAEITDSDDWREMEWLESEAQARATLDKERKEFEWRKDRIARSNVAQLEDLTLVQPGRESGVYALLIQLASLRPELFPFEIVDYDTHAGIDVIAKARDATPIGSAALYYVELKYYLERDMNHRFENIRYVVCWDTDVKNDGIVTDLSGEERVLKIVPADSKSGGYTGYFLRKNFKTEIEVFVLKDYLKEKLNLDFRPRMNVEDVPVKKAKVGGKVK